MTRIFNNKFLLIVAIVSVVFFSWAGVTQAVLPTERGFGDSCNAGVQAGCDDLNNDGDIDNQECGDSRNATCPTCSGRVDCSPEFVCVAGECVECDGQSDCNSLETCNNGVCVRRGGNGVGGLCNLDSQCASGQCGANNLCLSASGEEPPPDPRGGPGEADWMGIDLTIQDVFAIINGLACWFARIASLLMVIFIILAGIRFMAARGDPKAYDVAKKNFGHVLIGLLVILGVYVIIATVANAVGVTDFSFIPLVC